MEKETEHKITMTWAFDGHFSAIIINGRIHELRLCEPGKGPDDVGACLTSTDSKHLHNIYQALGELFKEEEEQQRLLGYSFAKPTEPQNEN